MSGKKPKAKKKRTPSQLGKMSREKGARYERFVANQLKETYTEAKRGIGQARSASEVADVDGIPWWLEAKNHKRVVIRRAFEQGEVARLLCSDVRKARLPVLVVSRDHMKCDLATMRLDVLKKLLFELEKLREKFDASIGD